MIKFLKNEKLYAMTGLLAKKDLREYLKYLSVKAGQMYATNAKLLMAVPTELEDGTYMVLKRTKTVIEIQKIDDDIQFPECEGVLAPAEGHIGIAPGACLSAPEFYWRVVMATEKPWNYKDIALVCGLLDEDSEITFDNGKMVFASDNFRAATMKMLVND